MPLKTQIVQLTTVADGEIARVAALETQAAAQAAEIARLTALIPPPPPPPPMGSGAFRVDGGVMRDPMGNVWSARGIEYLWGPTSAGAPSAAVEVSKALGANMIAPIFGRDQSSLLHVANCLAVADSFNAAVAVNADGAGVDRAWLKRADIVKICNEARCVAMLECEVELGSKASMTATQWRDTAIAFVLDLRAAGHTKPIRVGSPSGGRFTKYARQQGAAVLAADPLHNCLFTWQAYIDSDPSGTWQYQDDEGVDRGTAGALQLADLIKATGLCWLVGLDGADDIGPTPYVQLAQRLHQHGIGWQWWALFVGDPYGNGLVSNALDASSLKGPFGPTVRDLLRSQSVLPRLF
jgi:hypothetical protein